MNIHGKQLVHTRSRQKLLTLCAYGVIENRDDGVFAGRIDEPEGMLFQIEDRDGFFELMGELREGIEQNSFLDRLKSFVGKEDPEELVEQLIRGGVLE